MVPISDPQEILNILKAGDWPDALQYASWSLDDVDRILALDEGYNDGPNWLLVVQLKDGRFSFLSAGCDFTGWDCQANGNSDEKESLPELVRYGMGREDRDRLGFPQPK